MTHPPDSKIFTHLLNSGPCTADDLPGASTSFGPELRQDGLRKFKIPGGHGDIDAGLGTNQTPVYYADGKHSPESVIEAWRNANQSSLEHLSSWSLHHKIARNYTGFKDASREVFGPFESPNQGGGSGLSDDDCPFCGSEMSSFPVHVEDCPEA